MKNTATPRSGIEAPGRGPLITKGILLLVFLAGLGVIVLGVTGMRAYEASGFSSENAYSAIHALGESTAEAWRKLDSQLGGLSAGQRSQADQAAESLLLSAWENQSAGGGAKADALLKDAPAADRAALSWKLLYATYLTGGPKVSSGQKKEIAAVPEHLFYEIRCFPDIFHGTCTNGFDYDLVSVGSHVLDFDAANIFLVSPGIVILLVEIHFQDTLFQELQLYIADGKRPEIIGAPQNDLHGFPEVRVPVGRYPDRAGGIEACTVSVSASILAQRNTEILFFQELCGKHHGADLSACVVDMPLQLSVICDVIHLRRDYNGNIPAFSAFLLFIPEKIISSYRPPKGAAT